MSTEKQIINLFQCSIKRRIHYAASLAFGSSLYSYYHQNNKYKNQLNGQPVPWSFHILPVTGWTLFGFCLPTIGPGVFIGLRLGEGLNYSFSAYDLWKRNTINDLSKKEGSPKN